MRSTTTIDEQQQQQRQQQLYYYYSYHHYYIIILLLLLLLYCYYYYPPLQQPLYYFCSCYTTIPLLLQLQLLPLYYINYFLPYILPTDRKLKLKHVHTIICIFHERMCVSFPQV